MPSTDYLGLLGGQGDGSTPSGHGGKSTSWLRGPSLKLQDGRPCIWGAVADALDLELFPEARCEHAGDASFALGPRHATMLGGRAWDLPRGSTSTCRPSEACS